MELTKQQVKNTKGIAILFMLLLHLFCTKTYEGVFTPLIMIGKVPLVYYLALFGDCCVPIYCFCSGYGLFISYEKYEKGYNQHNLRRILKLYINFWIVLVLFVVLLGPIMGRGNSYPGDWKTFVLTATGLEAAYNGAWWFFTTYIILTIFSPITNKIVKRFNPILIVGISFVIYFIAYLQRIKGVLVVDNVLLSWLIRQFALWGTSQFAFIIGSLFAHYKIYSKIATRVKKINHKNLIGTMIILSMIVAHGIVETMFVAPFTGIVFIVVFNMMEHPKWLDKVLNYVGIHSTNMWLIHMFFYMIYFKELIFSPKNSVLIFIWLVGLCIASSSVINFIYKYILIWTIDRHEEPIEKVF